MSISASKSFFKSLESLPNQSRYPLEEVLANLPFDDKGLIPAIAQDAHSGEVLMLAWMNRESLDATLATGNMTYWSRSRQSLWIKGETSGHYQRVQGISFDCDGDAVLCQVEQTGSACHTGRHNCFYLQVDREEGQVEITPSVEIDPVV